MVIDDKNSERLPVTSGVPQGPLGLLCLFCSSMICLVLCRSVAHWLSLFADDSKCFRTIRSASDCVLFQGDIDNLVEWSDVWKMALSSL